MVGTCGGAVGINEEVGREEAWLGPIEEADTKAARGRRRDLLTWCSV